MLVAGLIGSFVLIIAGFAIAKAKYKGDFKVEPSWIAAALAPTIIWLLASGQLTEFSGLGVSFELSEATQQSFSLDLAGSKVDVQEISQEVFAAGVELFGAKGGVSLIKEYIEKGISAISIEMGRTRYYSSYGVAFAIEELTAIIHDGVRV